jgi:hypothetical protein
VAVVASLAFARRREELTCVTSAVCPLPTAPRPPRDCFPHSTRTAAACISNPESVGGVGEHDCSAAPKQERPERLYEVQERVYGGRTGLAPVREAVPTPARVVGRHVDRFWRAAFHDVYVDAPACQRAALENGGDRWPNLCVRGAHLRPVHHMPRRRVHSAPPRQRSDEDGWRQMREVATTQAIWSSAIRLNRPRLLSHGTWLDRPREAGITVATRPGPFCAGGRPPFAIRRVSGRNRRAPCKARKGCKLPTSAFAVWPATGGRSQGRQRSQADGRDRVAHVSGSGSEIAGGDPAIVTACGWKRSPPRTVT